MIHFYFSLDYFLTNIIPSIKTVEKKDFYEDLLESCRTNLQSFLDTHISQGIHHPMQERFYRFTITSIGIMLVELHTLKIKQ